MGFKDFSEKEKLKKNVSEEGNKFQEDKNFNKKQESREEQMKNNTNMNRRGLKEQFESGFNNNEYVKEQFENNVNINDIDEKELKFAERKVENMFNKFKGKSEDELISELYKNIEKQKQDGTFNYENIKNSMQKIKPFLNIEQQRKVDLLLEKIKG